MILQQAIQQANPFDKFDLWVQKITAAGEPKVKVITPDPQNSSYAPNSITVSLKKSHSICDLKSNVCAWYKQNASYSSSNNFTCNASFKQDEYQASGYYKFKVKVGDLYLTMCSTKCN